MGHGVIAPYKFQPDKTNSLIEIEWIGALLIVSLREFLLVLICLYRLFG